MSGERTYKEVRAKTGEDRDGKAIYRTIGRVLETKAGPMLKLDSIPLLWDGWAYISEPKEKDDQRRSPAQQSREQGPRSELDHDVPFSDPYKGRYSYVV
jgi:hypothetical protein